MEREREQQQRLRELRAERKARKERQLVLPDPSTADFERQLRKLATKGGDIRSFKISTTEIDSSRRSGGALQCHRQEQV